MTGRLIQGYVTLSRIRKHSFENLMSFRTEEEVRGSRQLTFWSEEAFVTRDMVFPQDL